jgi:hypothetical protein
MPASQNSTILEEKMQQRGLSLCNGPNRKNDEDEDENDGSKVCRT